jgi:nucleoside-diphosphate-sugar epimerase
MKYTILGAGGSIGNALAHEILGSGQGVRLVSRSNYSIPGAESFKADITSYKETLESIKGTDVVFLTVGLKYDIKVWRELWPGIMRNTIDACKNVNAKLIFFDNVYMYGKVDGKMTEATPYNPCSKKGELRAEIANLLENEMNGGQLNAIIARAADLYGPYADRSSMPYILVIDKLMKGKSAQWMVDVNTTHSFSYTLDSAKALYMLAGRPECYNQVWHMPTFNPAINGKEFIDLVAKELKVAPKIMVLKKWMVKTFGLFDPTVSELYEMLYQNEFPYYFDSSKFDEFFHFHPTPYDIGIRDTVEFLNKK